MPLAFLSTGPTLVKPSPKLFRGGTCQLTHLPSRADGSDELSESATHAYPQDLARAVHARWTEMAAHVPEPLKLPEPAALEQILSVCYQASLLHEEGRPITFRVAFASPDAFEAMSGPPAGLHRLLFTRVRPLDEHELRRLSPAAAFSRSLIGATADPVTGPEIWGIVHSGPQWLQSVRGGRETQQAIPPVLIVAVSGPGRLLVSVGTTTIAELGHGTLAGRGMDVFQAAWLEDVFAEIAGRPQAEPSNSQLSREPWRGVDERLGAVLACHLLRRTLATVRAARHGGTLIVVPQHRAPAVLGEGRYLSLKYAFVGEEPRWRISTLITEIMNEFAKAHAHRSAGDPLGWNEYEVSSAGPVKELDDALFEVAHLIADLTDVDGAVVLTDRFDLLGFGGEIAGDLPEIPLVARARDLDATDREWVRTDRVGTRHRSAYRLCHVMHDALGVVASQDGGLRFIRWFDDAVTYWDQVATGPWEV